MTSPTAAPAPLRPKAWRGSTFSPRCALIVLAGLLCAGCALLGGIALFSTTALIQLATLPCEINASKRAIAMLREGGQYSERELECAEKVLSAAAMTYVASLLISVIQVLRLGESFGARRRP